QLKIDDFIYVAHVDSYIYEKKNIISITSSDFTYYYPSSDYRFQLKDIRDKMIHRNSRNIFFANEVDAIRYCKAQMMKELFKRIEMAKKAIDNIKALRLENFQLLNHEWTDSEIIKLEKQLKQ